MSGHAADTFRENDGGDAVCLEERKDQLEPCDSLRQGGKVARNLIFVLHPALRTKPL